ncbi:MAG: hypothetical protein N2491_10825 [Negativicutes bacterium]|nr:hypothetical protein [Negativicutes bacterium]
MDFLTFMVIAIVALALGVWLYIVRQGDAEFEFIVDQRTDFRVDEQSQSAATFSCKIPFVNKGTQDGTIMDCYPRHLMPKEYYNKARIQSWLTLESNPRDDGYWEAIIIFKTTGDAIILTIRLEAKEGTIAEALKELPDLPVDIVYQVVARSDWYITKTRMTVPAEELRQAIANAGISAQTA